MDLIIIFGRPFYLEAGILQQGLEAFFRFGFKVSFCCTKDLIVLIHLAQLQTIVHIILPGQECLDIGKGTVGVVLKFLLGRFHQAAGFPEPETVLPEAIISLHGPVKYPGELAYFGQLKIHLLFAKGPRELDDVNSQEHPMRNMPPSQISTV
jgi:hypothetical protein